MSSLSLPLSLAVTDESRRRMESAFDAAAPGLYRYLVVRSGGDTHLADDLMQQLWLQASQANTTSLTGDLGAWLTAIARNLLRAHWRKRRNRPAHVPVEDPSLSMELAERIGREPLPDEWIERREVRDQLLLALTELGSVDQELIIGHYFYGRSLAEIGHAAGLSERSVEGRLYRARQALREKLRELAP